MFFFAEQTLSDKYIETYLPDDKYVETIFLAPNFPY
jgi:hypothetical protein